MTQFYLPSINIEHNNWLLIEQAYVDLSGVKCKLLTVLIFIGYTIAYSYFACFYFHRNDNFESCGEYLNFMQYKCNSYIFKNKY